MHATGQVVSFKSDTSLDVEALQRSLNRQLEPEIAVYDITEVDDHYVIGMTGGGCGCGSHDKH